MQDVKPVQNFCKHFGAHGTIPDSISTTYIPEIEGIQVLEVVPLLLCHARLGTPAGCVGADVFGVISGTVEVLDAEIKRRFKSFDRSIVPTCCP
jgi:hypothetical protein